MKFSVSLLAAAPLLAVLGCSSTTPTQVTPDVPPPTAAPVERQAAPVLLYVFTTPEDQRCNGFRADARDPQTPELRRFTSSSVKP